LKRRCPLTTKGAILRDGVTLQIAK